MSRARLVTVCRQQPHTSASFAGRSQPWSYASATKSARAGPRARISDTGRRVAAATASAMTRNGAVGMSIDGAASGNAVPLTRACGSALTYPWCRATKSPRETSSASASRSAVTHGSTVAPITSRCVLHGHASGHATSPSRHGLSATYRTCLARTLRSRIGAGSGTRLVRPSTPNARPSWPSIRASRRRAASGSEVATTRCG